MFSCRALSSQPGTPDIHRVWRLEQADDEGMSSGVSVESLSDQDSDTGIRPVGGRKKCSKRRLTGTVTLYNYSSSFQLSTGTSCLSSSSLLRSSFWKVKIKHFPRLNFEMNSFCKIVIQKAGHQLSSNSVNYFSIDTVKR